VSRRPVAIALAAVLVVGLLAGVGVYLLVRNQQLPPAPLQSLVGGRSVRVLGQAMYPTLRDNDLVTFDTRAYRDHAPQRGDIVLFTPPDENSRLFINYLLYTSPSPRALSTGRMPSSA